MPTGLEFSGRDHWFLGGLLELEEGGDGGDDSWGFGGGAAHLLRLGAGGATLESTLSHSVSGMGCKDVRKMEENGR